MNRSTLNGMSFALPWLVGFSFLVAYPFVVSIYWSFHQADLINPPQWSGLQHYERLAEELSEGEGFGKALQNTAYYSLLSVPLTVAMGLFLAVLLSLNLRGQAIYRTLFFLPAMIPVVATSVLWIWLLDPQDGMMNYWLAGIGVPPQNWLTQARSAVSGDGLANLAGWLGGENELRLMGSKDSLVLMSVWCVGNVMIIFMAGIGDIPKSLYEAARIDGAGPFQRFRHLTLPMLSPVIFFNLVMGLIRSVQSFTAFYILSEGTGQPGDSMLVVSIHLFLSAFSDLQMGYTSAMAWVLFALLVTCTVLLFQSTRYWVRPVD